MLIDIGVNVQPNGPKGSFTSRMAATPKQGTPVVPGQTVVRALEIDVLGSLLTVGIANAAAGPSSAAPAPVPTAATTAPAASALGVDAASVPRAIPAGAAGHGTPLAPIVLLVTGLLMAGAGATAWRLRGGSSG
jgi:hypothetical protein